MNEGIFVKVYWENETSHSEAGWSYDVSECIDGYRTTLESGYLDNTNEDEDSENLIQLGLESSGLPLDEVTGSIRTDMRSRCVYVGTYNGVRVTARVDR